MSQTQTLDPAEIEKFARIADQWWVPNGKFAPLHKMNPTRLGFIRDEIIIHFDRDERARRPFGGLNIVDVGCGGGLVAEPMARLGAAVTGLDAAGESLNVAIAHAAAGGLAIDYRRGVAEDLAAEAPGRFDVVLALEIVEHVADLDAFLAACAALTRPGGLVILSTINRTPEAYALAIIAAERVLRWLPEGAHDFKKLVTPDELAAALSRAGLTPNPVQAMNLDPLSRTWRLGGLPRINYLISAAKPE
jgi:2-polyprenyl-6-hydroxyphenyl methylase/3-demethylubiquinone-9 3-methyltransferase